MKRQRITNALSTRQRFSSLRPSYDLPDLQAALHSRREEQADNRSWYSIKAISNAETEVFIYDEIGFWGVTAADFIRDLEDVKASKINLRINSPGGDVFDGIAIYNAIKRHSANVTTYVDGIAASAASFIAQAGDRVVMSPHSQIMIHDAAGFAMGNSGDMRKLADILDSISNNIAGIYAESSGGTVDYWRTKMLDETWYSDKEAVEAGLADEVLEDEEGENRGRRRHASNSLADEPAVVPDDTQGDDDEPNEPDPTPEDNEPPAPKPVDWSDVFRQSVEKASQYDWTEEKKEAVSA